MKEVVCGDGVTLYDLEPVVASFLSQVVAGLSQEAKTLPCKFFYDAQGSALFEAISELPEYYPTRLELEIMEDMSPVMASILGERVRLIEFGSGSSQKTRFLLSALKSPSSYVPIDISRDHLIASAKSIHLEYPDLVVQPLCADYTKPFELPPEASDSATTVAYFPGSTIGNFNEAESLAFLTMVAERVGEDGALLLGMDRFPADHHGLVDSRQKPKTIEDLHRAYNDASGITAQFNLNLLERMKRELDADVDVESFRHEAIFDETNCRIEMRLTATRALTIRVGEHEFALGEGEWITTEHSYKYDASAVERIAAPAGFPMASAQTFNDDDGWFVVYLLLRPGHPRARRVE